MGPQLSNKVVMMVMEGQFKHLFKLLLIGSLLEVLDQGNPDSGPELTTGHSLSYKIQIKIGNRLKQTLKRILSLSKDCFLKKEKNDRKPRLKHKNPSE